MLCLMCMQACLGKLRSRERLARIETAPSPVTYQCTSIILAIIHVGATGLHTMQWEESRNRYGDREFVMLLSFSSASQVGSGNLDNQTALISLKPGATPIGCSRRILDCAHKKLIDGRIRAYHDDDTHWYAWKNNRQDIRRICCGFDKSEQLQHVCTRIRGR